LLIDTSALLRTLQVRHTQYETVARALETLPRRGYDLHLVPQNLFELWVVATRPVAQNGLGLSVPKATSELMRRKSMFTLLPDTPAIYPVWENLVIRYHVSGKPAHDARLVAAMRVHGLTSILTFDRPDFPATPALKLCILRTRPFEPSTFPPARKAAAVPEVCHAHPGDPLPAQLASAACSSCPVAVFRSHDAAGR